MANETMHDWLQLIKSEFLEMPGLQLTRSQFQRLWSLDAQFCDRLLAVLLATHVLEKTPRDAYVLAGGSSR
jgi:hypothetical protein